MANMPWSKRTASRATLSTILAVAINLAIPLVVHGQVEDTIEQLMVSDSLPPNRNDNDKNEVPSKPLDFKAHGITSTTIELSWSKPKSANAAIEGYRIYYMHSNYTDVSTYKLSEEDPKTINFNLLQLYPFTNYNIWVKAFTRKNVGEPSDHIMQRTDVAGPHPPVILNLTCQAEDALYLLWNRPATYYNSVDYYYIKYRIENAKDFEEIELSTDTSHLESGTTIPNLTMNAMYEISVQGATRSVVNPIEIIRGDSAPPKKILLAHDCNKSSLLMRSSRKLSTGVIAGMVCACLAVMLTITSFVLWRPVFRKCFHSAYYYLDYPPRNVPTLQEWENSEQDGKNTAVAVQHFAQHVASLHADGDIGFSKEYDVIQSDAGDYTVENSQFAENKTKNRYLNILAYDHSRVQLLSCGGGPQKKGQDYVNANYIDGWQRPRAYIGTQGPLPPTFESFWRMVWEQRVSIIVMITNLVERGRRKCDMYWPKEGTETYGYVQVSLTREDIMATYTIRTLQIRHLKQVKKKRNGTNMAERTVLQYHYTGWPDHGVPDHPLPVLNFIRKSSNANPPDAGPIIVHCSAGVGRTGTYIVIDAMLKQAKNKGEINVYGFLKHIRTQRNFLVQTEEQYIFIHDALQEAIESGETNIGMHHLAKHVEYMLCPSNSKTNPWDNLEAQYKLVTSWKPKEFNLVSARKLCNIHKNRDMDIIPIENARVHLTPKPGVDGSDYINATWFAGLHRNQEFIITQHPLEHSIMEFWQMMWDHNAQTIVMLTQCDETYPEFWPIEGKDFEFETFRVRLCGVKKAVSEVVLRDVAVRSSQDDYNLSVKIIQGPFDRGEPWPHHINSKAFVDMIQDVHRDYQNGPIVVMDRFGGIEAGLFVLLTTFSKQIECEQSADVYMFSKLLYMKRPGIFRSKEDYVLLYHSIESMLSSKSRTQPDFYDVSNGYVTSMNEANDVTTVNAPVQHVPVEYPVTLPVIQDYVSVCRSEEYVPVNSMPIHASLIKERSCPTNNACSVRGDHLIEENPTMQIHGTNFTSDTGAPVTIDVNGCVTHGNMQMPLEKKEATYTIA